MEIPREPRRSQVVNLTPLIDVVFLLIVFFMLSTSFTVSESMELAIPAQDGKAIASDEVWVLRVLADDRIDDNGKSLALTDFNRELWAKLSADKQQKILVLAAKGVTVQQLVTVLDKIYLAGGRQVQIDRMN